MGVFCVGKGIVWDSAACFAGQRKALCPALKVFTVLYGLKYGGARRWMVVLLFGVTKSVCQQVSYLLKTETNLLKGETNVRKGETNMRKVKTTPLKGKTTLRKGETIPLKHESK